MESHGPVLAAERDTEESQMREVQDVAQLMLVLEIWSHPNKRQTRVIQEEVTISISE